MNTTSPATDHGPLQRRVLIVLAIAQIFSGIATAAVLSTGSLLAAKLSGSDAWGGSITTAMTLGAALTSALLIQVASKRGRRIALSGGLLTALIGVGGVLLAASLGWFWLFLAAGVLIGAANAVNLQARFAATDLSKPERRGRDLSLVVWMTTVGAVSGPNLAGFGDGLARHWGLPDLTGLFLLAAAGLIVALAVISVGLRPDPYLVASAGAPVSPANKPSVAAGWRVFGAYPLAGSALVMVLTAHAVMVAVMSLTPVHMDHHGASVSLIGVTVSLHIAGMYALAPVMGQITDRCGPRPVALAGFAALIASVVIAGSSTDNHALTIIGLIGLGLGWSAVTVAGAQQLIAAVPLEQRLAAQGVSDSLMSLAGGGGGLLAGVAVATIGFAGLGLASAAVCLIGVAAAVSARR